jgi:hypothetical protein
MNDLQQKRRKPPYRKPESVKELENQYFDYECAKHPNFPYPVKTKFRDDGANGLTKCVVKWLELHGYFAGRVNTTVTYSQKLKRYIHSGSRNGMADVTAIVNGRHVSIEVKIGRDTLRVAQMRVKDEVEKAGGTYIVARSFENFLEQIEPIIDKKDNFALTTIKQ